MPPKNPLNNLGAFAHPAKVKKPAKPKATIPGDTPTPKPKKDSKGMNFTRPMHENNFKRVTKSPFE